MNETRREITIVNKEYVWLSKDNFSAWLHAKPPVYKSARKNRKAWKNLWNEKHEAYIKVTDEGDFRAGFDYYKDELEPKLFSTIDVAEGWIVKLIEKKLKAAIALSVYMGEPYPEVE